MSLPYPVIQLKKGKERSLIQKHPWVFSGAIHQEPPSIENGATVQVHSYSGEYLATGHFQRGTISVRCFDFTESLIDADFIRLKLRNAIRLREAIFLPRADTNCFRLLHGEGDGMPGLIADIYGNTLILQTYTIGMHQLKKVLAQIIPEEIPYIDAIYDKSTETMSKHGIQVEGDGYLFCKPDYQSSPHVLENDIKFSVDYAGGQKTGFFLDQRENRLLLKYYAKDKKVLNTFCYTGGFSLAALAGKAKEVQSIDSSSKAILGLEKNLQLNGLDTKHISLTSDVMGFLKQADEDYDILILDPPAYAKHLSQISNAMIGYRNLNTEGLKHVRPGGLLFTFSCSQAIDKELFRKLIFQSALSARREVKILHHLSQPPDHPVSIYHPEAEYLKGFVLLVN